jgi:hypothetical protein
VCRYDDGTGDVLTVPLGTTAFAAGKTMWALLPPELKSVAVRARVRYAPHPYVWMGPVHAKSTGLGLECEGLEVQLARCRYGRRRSSRRCRSCVILHPFIPDSHLVPR